MMGTLKNFFPTVYVISEESKTFCNTNAKLDLELSEDDKVEDTPIEFVNEQDVTVWIDPLDATKEYTGLRSKIIIFLYLILLIICHRKALPIRYYYGVCCRKRKTHHWCHL